MDKFRVADNRMIHTHGHDFVFLTEDNTIYEVDGRIKAVLQSSDSGGQFTREDLLARLDDSCEEQNNLFRDLSFGRVIIPATQPSNPKPIDFNELTIELKTLVLHVTDACNLGCRYCYYCNDNSAKLPKEKMSIEVAEKAIDFLLDHSGNLQEVIIVFFGGEPLLNFDLITTVVASARKKAAKRGKKVDFALTTNATLLNDETVAYLIENDIGVTISIDGNEVEHDRYRRYISGAPSYQSILPGLKKLLHGKSKKPVVARVTVAGAATNISERLDHLLSLGFSEVGFAPVTTNDPNYQLDEKEMQHLLDQFKALTEKFIHSAKKGAFYGFTNIVDNLVVLHEGERKDYPCGAGLGLFSVDPKGRLYPCQRLTGERLSLMGDIFKGFNRSVLDRFRKTSILDEKEECSDCWVRKICAGGCYHEALVREGSLRRPNIHYCQWIKAWVQLGLEVYGRLVVECPDYLDKLSLLRGHEPLFSQPL